MYCKRHALEQRALRVGVKKQAEMPIFSMRRARREARSRYEPTLTSPRRKSARSPRACTVRGLVWWQVSLIATSTSAGMSALVTGRLAACPDSVGGIARSRLSVASQSMKAARIRFRQRAVRAGADDVRQLGHFRRRASEIEAHHVVDHDAVGEPVVQIGDASSSACAHGVNRAQVLLERDRTHHRAHQHVGARLRGCAARAPRCAATVAAMRAPSKRNAVAQRVIGRRQVRLDVVGQRVHAGRAR